jgi:polyprenyl-phospho-N-acetylgalactosaminyl synthase
MSSITNASVFVVVPTYNEATALRATLLPLIYEGYSVVVVDDCSADNTYETIQDLSLHYLRHPINMGQGGALQTGMEYALAQEAAYVVHFDADGQHDHREIPALLAPVVAGEADIALGTRFQRQTDTEAVPVMRRLLLKAATVVNGLTTGMWLTDAHNGFRGMNRRAAEAIRITENRMAHATEILSLIRQAKLRVCEVPVHIIYTDYSKAKGQSALNAFNILIDLIMKKLLL